jgi:hypothetical protein
MELGGDFDLTEEALEADVGRYLGPKHLDRD